MGQTQRLQPILRCVWKPQNSVQLELRRFTFAVSEEKPPPPMDVSSWFRRSLFGNSKNTKNPDLPDQPALDDEDILGVTEQLIDFVKSFTLETFKDFPRSDNEAVKRGEDCSGNVRNDLSEWQERHAILILSKVKELAQLRYKLCPGYLKEPQFWRIYFSLVKSHVADYELQAIRRVKIKEMAALENGKSMTDKTACEVELAETKSAANLPPGTP